MEESAQWLRLECWGSRGQVAWVTWELLSPPSRRWKEQDLLSGGRKGRGQLSVHVSQKASSTSSNPAPSPCPRNAGSTQRNPGSCPRAMDAGPRKEPQNHLQHHMEGPRLWGRGLLIFRFSRWSSSPILNTSSWPSHHLLLVEHTNC